MGDEEVMGEQHPGSPCKGSAQGKGHDFVFGGVDAHGVRRNFVFADGQAGPAVGRVLKVFDKEQYGDHQPEGDGEVGHTGNAHQTGSTADIFNIEDADTDDFA